MNELPNMTIGFRMKLITVFLLCAILTATFVLPPAAYARDSGKTVRVGWYESVFNQTDSFGRRSGLGYEYQQRIAAYTGWNYEYVEGSWSELFEMLETGQIDLLSDISYTEDRAKRILYSSESMGSEEYHAFIAPQNTQISPEDFSTFDGKRVGVNKDSLQETLFKDWAEEHDVHPVIVELSVASPEQIEMLKNEDIDVLVTLDSIGSAAGMLSVCRTGSSDYYFGISRKQPELKTELDNAMNRILEENRYYNQQLAEKYSDIQAINGFLAPDEKTWLSDHSTIRVGYQNDYLPFCDTEGSTDAVTGALADYLDLARTAERNAELNFETRGFDSTDDGLKALLQGEIDCLFPVNLSDYDGENLGVIVTDPLIKTEIYAAVRTADHKGVSADSEVTVAVGQGNRSYETFLMDSFPKWQMVSCDDLRDGCHLVSSGQADCLLVSNYRLNRISDMCRKYELSTVSTGEASELSFAVRRDDYCLYSILNKINHLIPDSVIEASLTNYSFETDRVTFGEFLADNLIYVVAVAAIVASVILLLLLLSLRSGKRAFEGRQLISETERDRLTGLYNRNYFFVYADRLFHEDPHRPMDAIVINIDRFHSVNSLNGRAFGDEVLRALGIEIEACASEMNGIAGRFEGDHFDIYCVHRDDYKDLLQRLQSRLDTTFRTADIHLRMGVMPWQEGMKPEPMFDLARSACSMIRGNYNTHLMIYDEDLRRHDQFNQKLQHDLSRALEKREFEVYYQPKYDIRSETPRLSSAEALVRWRHPELGLIAPNDFIPLFEQSGQISELDRYVWTESARQIAEWRDRYGTVLPVSVNISRIDVFDPNLSAILDEIVTTNGLDCSDLKLEITESAYTENADHLLHVIRGLREKGYEIEMDDFGSGYSSLSMLSTMPVDVLKMDRGFIRNMEHNEKDIQLVELILNIAEDLRVPVIAEGVETEAQLRLLKSMGCAIVQGYYFSRPLSAAQFEADLLAETEPPAEADPPAEEA